MRRLICLTVVLLVTMPLVLATAAPAQTVNGVRIFEDRASAIAASQRLEIDTEALYGSINLTGARLDDLELKQYRETTDPDSPIMTLLTPSGAPNAYFVEQGWVPAAGAEVDVPTAQTVWSVEGENTVLSAESPVTLVWDNGEGLIFRRTFSVDEHYLFTVTQTVENQTEGAVALYPYARVERQGTPQVQNFFIQHEGPHGVLGANNLVSRKYGDLQNDQQLTYENTTGWLGFTDKYWATAVLPQPGQTINARFNWRNPGAYDEYQTSFVETAPVVVPPGGAASNETYVFAGAKEEAVITAYEQQYGFDRLELLMGAVRVPHEQQEANYLCVGDSATGFRTYGASWQTATFDGLTSRFVVKIAPSEVNVTPIGRSDNLQNCRIDPGALILICGNAGHQFAMNVRTLKFQEFFGHGYVDVGADVEDDSGGRPRLVIGRCSPL